MNSQDDISTASAEATIDSRGTPGKAAAATKHSPVTRTETQTQTPAATVHSAAIDVQHSTPPQPKQDASIEEVQQTIEMPQGNKTRKGDEYAQGRQDSAQPPSKPQEVKVIHDNRPMTPDSPRQGKPRPIDRW